MEVYAAVETPQSVPALSRPCQLLHAYSLVYIPSPQAYALDKGFSELRSSGSLKDLGRQKLFYPRNA